MSYLSKFVARMGITGNGSSEKKRKRIDEATSNSSLSNLRYVITEKPKWKVFRKREVVPIPAYQSGCKSGKGCTCGSNGPCKQKVTPKGVTIHYPQKKKKAFSSFAPKKRTKSDRGFYNSPKSGNKVKSFRPKKFPTWRLDRMSIISPFFGPKIIKPRPYQ